MERYLTEKARPGLAVRLLENVALIVLIGLLAGCIWLQADMLMKAYKLGLFGLTNLLPVIPAILVALAMNPIAERIRARHHAKLIVKALLASEGKIHVDEVDDKTGMRRGADYAMQLVAKGYMVDVRLAQGFLCVADVADSLAPVEEVAPLFRDVEV